METQLSRRLFVRADAADDLRVTGELPREPGCPYARTGSNQPATGHRFPGHGVLSG
ncbi:MAG: hypothetical protein R3228_04185 [Halioglobus sp.]|nr:hypothetical protein [Halioglobus sp.]